MAKLEEWFKYKNGGPSGNGAQAPPPPPPASVTYYYIYWFASNWLF